MENSMNAYILVFCLLVGLTQLIGGSIRLVNSKHTSKYSKGLNRYFAIVIGYILSYLMITYVHNAWIEVDHFLMLFMPIIPICIAIYYWIVVYTFDKTEIE